MADPKNTACVLVGRPHRHTLHVFDWATPTRHRTSRSTQGVACLPVSNTGVRQQGSRDGQLLHVPAVPPAPAAAPAAASLATRRPKHRYSSRRRGRKRQQSARRGGRREEVRFDFHSPRVRDCVSGRPAVGVQHDRPCRSVAVFDARRCCCCCFRRGGKNGGQLRTTPASRHQAQRRRCGGYRSCGAGGPYWWEDVVGNVVVG